MYNPDYQPITANFCNYSVLDDDCSIASGEVAALLCDRQGIMWIGMIGGGVQLVNPHKARFSLDRLSQVKRVSGSSSVRSMTVDNQGKLWLGTGTDGFGILDRRSGHFTYYKQWDEFVACRPLSSVMCIMQSPSTGRMWLGVYDGGIYEIDSSAPVGKRVTHYDGATLQCDECVYGLYEDTDRNLWIAARGGISMRASDGIAMCMDLSQVEGLMTDGIVFVQLIGGNGIDKWAASNTSGILRISGRGNRKEDYQLRAYSEGNGKLTDNHINCVFRDSRGRIWAGTGGSGLNLYKETEDRFVPVHVAWNLPGDAVISMLEDDYGCLWLSTNAGLVKLCLSDDLQQVRVRLYTASDGLQDNLFNRGAVAKSADGELFFGGHHGYNSFYASHSAADTFVSPVVLTDVKLFNRSWSDLPWEERQRVSLLAPAFSEELCLDYRHNNFTLEFSALEYASPDRNRYAYKLEGFDADWQYTDASRHFAYYNNLAPGRYLFRVKASNSAGVWNEVTTDKAIVVLPPPWRTGWAYLGYLLLTLVVGCLIFRMVRNRIRLRAALHLREMEKAKVEELNHVKLQFFTNVTHELLTPLTILSVSVEELKQIAPDFKEQYQVMTSNINRLIRLLRQILEFRKAETGNLKLRVTNGDLAAFLHRGVESFRPLMRKQDIHFQVSCTPDPFNAYFDTDKLDKIMYNLLSNVSKYGRPGEVVSITLEKDEKGWARLGVKDNGPGISPEAQKNLFKRFYEGDYRRFNTTGTGIGLSLVHDLVTLHHGTIEVESEKGKGTAFMITFPIERSAYGNEEIDAVLETEVENENISEEEPTEAETMSVTNPIRKWKLLLVEDNAELLHLMVKLLRPQYRVYTAASGEEALTVVGQKPVDLIVSDVMMPGMSGIELCRAIKTHTDTSHIPVLLLTVKHEEADRVEAYESGADGFIAKPFSTEVLMARVENLLRDRQRWVEDFKRQLLVETPNANYTGQDEDFLKQAIECVNRHLADPDFDLPQFLDEMHTTKTTCFRKLKALTGLTYISFVRNIRIKAACRIMAEKKNIRISDLAYSVGYNDPRYFSSLFKKETGVLPSEYMERLK